MAGAAGGATLGRVCGRFNLTRPREIQERFGFVDWHERRIPPRFNIAPGQEILTIVQPDPDARPLVQPALWGLAARWLPAGRRQPLAINARAETVASNGLFRGALARSRCLIPATGFYEWQTDAHGRRRPVHIHLADGQPFAFAGLWLPDQAGQPTATIITTTPNALLEPIHTRMPVILEPADEALWLDPSVSEAPLLLPLLQPYPAEAMAAYRVAPLVNAVANDGPALIEPYADQEPATDQDQQLELPLLGDDNAPAQG